ncbi:hypothetical protein P153DRAFT_154161 [Dothidotthia symphoricarpi CBS 119687]|uniref:Uncharacterized protein n=1 Tax=Dothidotthia symphoricarpi CBS 119687 TaxID=1392245 RepID=A0A6A6AQ71_9PLEO|nr:uncharacterized protein P153DRAFT_154161 [Dothidotthia symphoricarpi CBS 119687]KAF2133308.1 hypothetical protein P153DRAFT_154161 [Dothidotthia symphoricarpi CBS 119687]
MHMPSADFPAQSRRGRAGNERPTEICPLCQMNAWIPEFGVVFSCTRKMTFSSSRMASSSEQYRQTERRSAYRLSISLPSPPFTPPSHLLPVSKCTNFSLEPLPTCQAHRHLHLPTHTLTHTRFIYFSRLSDAHTHYMHEPICHRLSKSFPAHVMPREPNQRSHACTHGATHGDIQLRFLSGTFCAPG